MWIAITDEQPKESEVVWGYDCFYSGQGACQTDHDRGRLIYHDGDSDCLITHWKRVLENPPLRADVEAVLKQLEKEETP
jgi:hypothetical protein